jgi:DNA-binding NarL/FixJ family response regulator
MCERSTQMLRLLLVEDHASFRGALASMLNRQPDLEVAAQCGSLAECHSLGGFDDIQLIGVLRRENPRVKVLILTASVEAGLLVRMAEAGADGVLHKTSLLQELVAEVKRLASGPNYYET